MITGIDISRHQGAVNLGALYGQDFVILRAGYGGGPDEQLVRNRDGLRGKVGALGFYFFAYPGRSSGRTQAEEFARAVGPLQPGEFVALDIENEPGYGRNLVASDVQWSLDFLRRAEELFGVKPLVYMDGGVKSKFNWQPVVDGNYGLWIAHWGRNDGQVDSEPSAAPWPFWTIHQFTSRGNVGGISPVDVNRFNGTVEQLLKYGKQGSTPAPTPRPEPAPAKPKTYTVRKGDSLSGVFGSNWRAVYELNKAVIGPDPNLIKAGQVLQLPGGSATPPPQTSHSYTVVSGDNLSKIAAKFGTTWQKLYEWNKGIIGPDPNIIKAGQKLRVR